MQIDQRILGVLVHVHKHLDSDLNARKLSEIACLSEFHFQRVFNSICGMPLAQYVKQARLKRASYQLAFRQHHRVIDVALDNGFSSAENFSRVFKLAFGVTPSQYRNTASTQEFPVQQIINLSNGGIMQAALTMADVEIVNFNEINIALYQHSGSQSGLTQSIQRFIQWRKDNLLHPSRYRTFNLVYVDPKVTSDQDYRFGLASQVDSSHYALAENMGYSQIPAGRCAHIRHTGPDEKLSHKVEFLYSHWLAATGNLPRDYPLFFERVSFFPEVSELEMITDIYLPIE